VQIDCIKKSTIHRLFDYTSIVGRDRPNVNKILVDGECRALIIVTKLTNHATRTRSIIVPRIDGDTQFDTAFIQSLAIDATTDSASYTWIAGERVLVKLAPNSASAVNFIVSTFLCGKNEFILYAQKGLQRRSSVCT
jgi:hypothetical protein